LARRQRFQRRENKLQSQFRVNDQIRVPEVRLVGDNLEDIGEAIGQTIESGIFPTRRLRDLAYQVELDLVEISPKADPPVVRIVDFKKFLYEKKKKQKEIKAKAL